MNFGPKPTSHKCNFKPLIIVNQKYLKLKTSALTMKQQQFMNSLLFKPSDKSAKVERAKNLKVVFGLVKEDTLIQSANTEMDEFIQQLETSFIGGKINEEFHIKDKFDLDSFMTLLPDPKW